MHYSSSNLNTSQGYYTRDYSSSLHRFDPPIYQNEKMGDQNINHLTQQYEDTQYNFSRTGQIQTYMSIPSANFDDPIYQQQTNVQPSLPFYPVVEDTIKSSDDYCIRSQSRSYSAFPSADRLTNSSQTMFHPTNAFDFNYQGPQHNVQYYQEQIPQMNQLYYEQPSNQQNNYSYDRPNIIQGIQYSNNRYSGYEQNQAFIAPSTNTEYQTVNNNQWQNQYKYEPKEWENICKQKIDFQTSSAMSTPQLKSSWKPNPICQIGKLEEFMPLQVEASTDEAVEAFLYEEPQQNLNQQLLSPQRQNINEKIPQIQNHQNETIPVQQDSVLLNLMQHLPAAYFPFSESQEIRSSDSQRLEAVKKHLNGLSSDLISQVKSILPIDFCKQFDVELENVFQNQFIMKGIRQNQGKVKGEQSESSGFERKIKVMKYITKRRKRESIVRKISCDVRRRVADSRLRVKGRFVTKEQALQMIGETSENLGKYSNSQLKAILLQKFGTEAASPLMRFDSKEGDEIEDMPLL